MLGKLLKYDLKKLLKFICIFYIITLIIGILTRLFINTDSPFVMYLIGKILSGTLISMFASILINCLMGLWIRSFAHGVYKDESYLTHTLPVTKTQIYVSKFLTAVITAFLSLTVIVGAAFIAYYTSERWLMVKQMFFAGSAWRFTVLVLIIFFLEFVNLIQCGYTGIILGHKMNTGKVGFSVLFAFLVDTVSQLIILAFSAAAALVNVDFKELFVSQNVKVAQDVLLWLIPIYLLVIAADAIINIKLLNKGVNID